MLTDQLLSAAGTAVVVPSDSRQPVCPSPVFVVPTQL